MLSAVLMGQKFLLLCETYVSNIKSVLIQFLENKINGNISEHEMQY